MKKKLEGEGNLLPLHPLPSPAIGLGKLLIDNFIFYHFIKKTLLTICFDTGRISGTNSTNYHF